MADPKILRVLDLSTRHLPPEVMERDAETGNGLGSYEGVVAQRLEHGWLMWLPGDPIHWSERSEEPMPDWLIRIQSHALLADLYEEGIDCTGPRCSYVLFDDEGHVADDLPTWEHP